MKLFLTSGTSDFMELLRKKHKKETMIVIHGGGNSVLVHETEGKTVFQTPRSYEVVGTSGDLQEEGFFAFNHIPVSDEGRPVFEHNIQNKVTTIGKEPGLIAFRLLRPLESDTYIVMTPQWTKSVFFDTWKKSSTYKETLEKHDSTATDKTIHIFTSAPYVTTFITKSDKEEQ